MTEKITLTVAQIQHLERLARAADFSGSMLVCTADIIALCTLALQAEAMQPRPIEEAPKDGTSVLLFDGDGHYTGFWAKEKWLSSPGGDWIGGGFTHFIPLTSLPEPRR